MSDNDVKISVAKTLESPAVGEQRMEKGVIEEPYPDDSGRKVRLVVDGLKRPIEYILFHADSSQPQYIVHFNRRFEPRTFDIKKYNTAGQKRPFTILGDVSFNAIIGVGIEKFGEKIFARDIPTHNREHYLNSGVVFDTARFAQHIKTIEMKLSLSTDVSTEVSGNAKPTAQTHYVTLGGAQWPVDITSNSVGEIEKVMQRRPDGVLVRTIECKNGKPSLITMHKDDKKERPHLIVELGDQQQLLKMSLMENDGSTIAEQGIFEEGKIILTPFSKGRPQKAITVLASDLYNDIFNFTKLISLAGALMPIQEVDLQLPKGPSDIEILDLYEDGKLRAFKRIDEFGHPEVWQQKSNGSLFTFTTCNGNRKMIESESSANVLEARLFTLEPGNIPEMFTIFHPPFNTKIVKDAKTKYSIEFNSDETGGIKSFTIIELDKAGNALHGSADVPIEQWGELVADGKIDTAPLKEKMEAIQKPFPLPHKEASPSFVRKDEVEAVTVDPEGFPDQEEIKNDYGGGEVRYFWKGAASKDGKPVPRCMLKYSSSPFEQWNSHFHMAAITPAEVSAGGDKLRKAKIFIKDQVIDDVLEVMSHHNHDVIIDFSFVNAFDPVYAEAIQEAENTLQMFDDPRQVLISGLYGREDAVRDQLIEGLKQYLGDEIESRVQPEHLNARDPDSRYHFLELTRREDYDEKARKIYSEDYRLGKMVGYREHEPSSGKPIQSKTTRPKPIVTDVLRVKDQAGPKEGDQRKDPDESDQVAVRGKHTGKKLSRRERLELH